MPTSSREYDIVLFGATGFTGGLTAEYLARHAPVGCRWALAGRNQAKLQAVRRRLSDLNPELFDLPLVHADVTEPTSLQAVAQSAKVVVTTVGPYVTYGEPLVAACADNGTAYLDLTGEPEFFDRMYVKYHDRALQTGARIIHASGFDSIPYDLGALFTVLHLPEGSPISVRGYVRAMGVPSGGTFHTAITAGTRAPQNVAAAVARRRAEPKPVGRKVRIGLGLPGWSPDVRAWVLPMPSLDPQIVARSARALDRYGPEFTYTQYAAIRRLATIGLLGAGLGAVVAASILPPTRNWLLNRRKPGEGPSRQRRAKSWFTVRFVGEAGGQRVVAEVAGGDPGYDETAKMLAEAALCLAFDDVPDVAGQVTTAMAMGEALIRRLQAAGLIFQVIDGPAPIKRRRSLLPSP